MSRDPTDLERLSKIDKAIDDSILEASEADLRDEFKEAGDDFDKAVVRAGRAMEQAKVRVARMRFKRAKEESQAYSERENVESFDLAKARRRLAGMRSGEVDSMMAARKGGKLSEQDEENMLKDLAQLEALENEDKEEGKE